MREHRDFCFRKTQVADLKVCRKQKFRVRQKRAGLYLQERTFSGSTQLIQYGQLKSKGQISIGQAFRLILIFIILEEILDRIHQQWRGSEKMSRKRKKSSHRFHAKLN